MESFIKNLAYGAGKILRDGFRKKMKIARKSGPHDIVTKYDFASERYIIGKIKGRFPGHGIISEESNPEIDNGKDTWIIDPLDGTNAFARGVAQFSVSIAYVHSQQLSLGVVYDPIADELFFAQAGHGAFLNNKKIRVSDRKELRGSLAIYSYNVNDTPLATILKDTKAISKAGLLPWCLCSSALDGAYVASGRADLNIDRDAHPWDYAAGALIMKEAGAKVTQADGKPYRWDSRSLLAANPVLHKKIINTLNKRR